MGLAKNNRLANQVYSRRMRVNCDCMGSSSGLVVMGTTILILVLGTNRYLHFRTVSAFCPSPCYD